MIGIYWRPQRVSRTAVALVAIVAMVGMFLVETFPSTRRADDFDEKVRAARIAASAMATLREERVARGYPIDPDADPHGSGMIGVLSSPITSTSGSLPSKQVSTNPSFAALMVHFLREAGVRRGDRVAVGLSGSFPAMNTATYAAFAALELEPVIVSSAAASEWGANLMNFGWVDMEAVLRERGHFPYRTVAGSLGGLEDRGVGMSRVGQSLLRSMLERHEIPVLEGEDVGEAIDARMRLFDAAVGAAPIRAYVNVGGGTASVGGRRGRAVFKPGVNHPGRPFTDEGDSVMLRFTQRGVPVVHVNQVGMLAATYGLVAGEEGQFPPIGEGPLYVTRHYNVWLTLIVLVVVLGLLLTVTRGEVSASLLPGGKGGDASRPQPMV